jgi:magnesium transporter
MPCVASQQLKAPVAQFMTATETAIPAHLSIREAIDYLRFRRIEHKIVYFYVVDADNKLLGVIATRKLLLADPAAKVQDEMDRPAISIPASATLEMALGMFALHRLLALPVVDDDGRLLGTVDVRLYAEEAMDLAEANRRADVFRLIGISVEQMRQGSPARAFRLRIPWLACNLAGGVACAAIAAMFEGLLAQIVIIAMFIPLVLTLSESISVQSLTLVLQHLHGRGVPWRQLRRQFAREWQTAGMLALACGLVVALAALFWAVSWAPIAIAVSIAITMVLAATMGTFLPVILHLLQLDPKIAAGPIVLMCVDVTTLAVYLSLSALWLL